MKPVIKIISSTFGKHHRQDVAVDSWLHIKKMYPDVVDIINIQFAGEIERENIPYPQLETKWVLSDSTITTKGTKNLPLVHQMLFWASQQCDENRDDVWFIWVNSDCIILPRMIDTIIKDKPDMKAFSRVDIHDVANFDEILNRGAKFVRMEPAGFDAVVFNDSWYRKNQALFENDFVIGRVLFDVYLAGIARLFGNPKDLLGNDLPPCLVHIWHETTSHDDNVENEWNKSIVKNSNFVRLVVNIMHYHLQFNICRRKDWGAFLQLGEKEKQFENDYFQTMNVRTENTIRKL